MKDAEGSKAEVKAVPAAPAAEESPAAVCKAVLQECTRILGSAVTAKETKLLAGRVLRKLSSVRKQLDAAVLRDFISDTLPAGSAPVSLLLNSLSKVISHPHPPCSPPHPAISLRSLMACSRGTPGGGRHGHRCAHSLGRR